MISEENPIQTDKNPRQRNEKLAQNVEGDL